jgi:hypothetical protein
MEFRKVLFLIMALYVGFTSDMSGQNSFYLNHGSLKECKFSSDAIYFLSDNDILDKTDYNGNTIWSKSIGANSVHLIIADDAIYYFLFHNMIKLDTSGNFIWGKDLSVPECGSHIFLKGLTVSDNRIFVSTSGDTYGWALPGGMLVYDTAGTLLNRWCDQTGNDNFITEGFPRLNGGAWFKFFDSGTGGSYTWLVQVDSLGNLIPNFNAIDLDGGLSQNVVDIILMPDSSYLSINKNFSEWMIWAPIDFHIDLTKFTKDGIVIWKRSYYSQTENLYLGAGGIDTIGNMYLIGEKTDDLTWSQFSIKLDSAGNILQSNEWLGLPYTFTYPDYSRMEYRNGFLYCPFTQNNTAGVFLTDTSLTPPCAITQSPYAIDTINTTIAYYPWFNYTPVTYANTSASVNIVQQAISTSSDLCLTLSSNDNISQEIFKVFPNPATESFKIFSDASNAQIEIYNSLGEICLQKSVSEFPAVIDVHELSRGFYFLKIETNERSLVTKIIIL